VPKSRSCGWAEYLVRWKERKFNGSLKEEGEVFIANRFESCKADRIVEKVCG
jgi:hypothetical protein